MYYHDAIRLESTATLANLIRTGIHVRACESLSPKPVIDSSGFVYDVAIFRPCDCFISQSIPAKHSERVKILKQLAREFPTHPPLCASNFTEPTIFKGRIAQMRLACNCWMSIPVRDEK